MTNKKIGFGRGNEEPITSEEFREYIGKYVVLQTPYNFSEVGKYIGMKRTKQGTFAVLNPHLGTRIDPKKGHIAMINKKDYKLNINAIIGIKPTTKKNLENSVEYSKFQADKEFKMNQLLSRSKNSKSSR